MPPTVPAVPLPPHLAHWQLPVGWSWGTESLQEDHRHFQEVVDALGRSLSLVSAPNPAHVDWLHAEARALAHRNHPAIPTTYHYWAPALRESRRGPGYLRRWIAGETLAQRVGRLGADDVPGALRLLREAGSAIGYLHDGGSVHGAVGGRNTWLTPSGRIWILGWQWAIPRDRVPSGLSPDAAVVPRPPEWRGGRWSPTPASDQWQLGALAFLALTGEVPPSEDVPPVRLLRPDCPRSLADVIERALGADPAERYSSVTALVRALDRGVSVRTPLLGGPDVTGEVVAQTPEARLRWATGDDYDILAKLGAGTFGSVWRVRDLALGREVALKMLHPHIARDGAAVQRFRREAQLAAQLAHPAIVPIFDFDTRAGTSWYTMELAEGGSVAELVRRAGPRPLRDVAGQVEFVLEGLAAAHAIGVIHRDLKPENLLIDRYRRWRVADFGIANALGEEVAGASGTPAFAPPEQLLGEPQGPASDCFSIAAIVFFVLTGEPPFRGNDGPTVLASQLAGRVDLARLPAPVAGWLRTGLAVDQDARPADAAATLGAWRGVRTAALRGEQRGRWWRRLLRAVRPG
ncbi:serine/threonine-protein kinase [Roseisolibacter sp. H3M3-2]|uniref:protein kinase domain-containing protein n=1 Tax=Roseisolibacter sp. H3M3-2 TaxID=3031323 RepID=UPI0023D997B9|nr:serine/threonine-protein kinase [Roseisolibacter sp. H3M3-2]MDF1505600.1 serine/threonine-protein kinase [Roseisolibacter sp. H3M3-2]